MKWFQAVLIPAAMLLQQQAGRAHVVVARQVTDTMMDEGRALLGPLVSSAHFRQLLSKMIELWDAYLAYDLTWTNPFRQQSLITRVLMIRSDAHDDEDGHGQELYMYGISKT